MDSIALKIRKEPVVTAMVVRVIILIGATYGFNLDETSVTPVVLTVWGLFEVAVAMLARSQVVPSVKLINQRTGEAKARVPEALKEKLDHGGSN